MSTSTAKKRSRDFLPNNNDDADAGDEQTIVHSPVSYTPPVSPGAEKRVRSRGSYRAETERGSYREERGSYREERGGSRGSRGSYRDGSRGSHREERDSGGGGTPSGSPPRDLERVTDSPVQRERERDGGQGRDHSSSREQSPGLRGRGSPYDNHHDHEHDLDLEPASPPHRDQSPLRTSTSPPHDPPATPQPLSPPLRESTTPSPSPPPHEPRQFHSQPQSQTPQSPPSPSPQNRPPPPSEPQQQSQSQSQPPPPAASQKEPEPETEKPPPPAAPETDDLLVQLPPHDWPSFLARFTAALHAVGDEKERIARELDMWNWMYEIWSTSRDRDDTRRLSREMATMVQWTQMKEEELERAREEHTRSMLAISDVLGIAPSGGPPGRR